MKRKDFLFIGMRKMQTEPFFIEKINDETKDGKRKS